MNVIYLHDARRSATVRAQHGEGPAAAEALTAAHLEPVMPDESLANRGLHQGDVLQVATTYPAWDYRPGDVVLATFPRLVGDPHDDGTSRFIVGVLQQDVHQGYWLEYDGPQPWGTSRIPGRPLHVVARMSRWGGSDTPAGQA